jgi:hypothetical protein
VKPLAPGSFALQCTVGQSTHDKLRYAQALLGHQLPSGDVAQVLDRALDTLIEQLERRKFAATHRARPTRRRSSEPTRHVPAHVRRAVWERDEGRCTFMSESGHRCPARTRLEFDHVTEVARGGEATVAGIQLRCRAHNQYGAECAFGAEFMRHKRESARRAAEARPQAARVQAAAADPAPEENADRDVIPWLRKLGFNAAESRRAAALCEDLRDVSLEQRLRVALRCFGKPGARVG